MIRKLLFSANLFVLLFTASNLFAAAPISSNKLVYFSQFNTLRSTYPVSQSASNFNSSLVSSATIDYGGSGISPKDFPRTNWDITNASSTLDPATAPYVEYTINFSSNVNIDLDRFVITGGGSNYSTKFELRWSKDNYATRLGLFSFGSDWQYKLSSVNLNTLSNFTGTQLKFRLYFYDTNASGSNLIHSDTGPYPSLDGTPASYDIWTATATVWVNPPPAISTITPSSGAIGSTVVINGTDFTGATTLSFNGTNATNFVVDSPTQITATVPVGTTTGPITVTTPNGTGTSATNFTVSLSTITTTGISAINPLLACVNSPSTAQTFKVSGSDLTQNIEITSSDPSNIEFSLTGISYFSSLTFIPNSGSVASKTVYVRQKPSVAASYSTTITIASTGATPTTFNITSTIGNGTAPTIADASNIFTGARSICQNSQAPTLRVTATGSGLNYQWYSNTISGYPYITSGGTLIPGATSNEYVPDTSSISTLYYYCVVTGTCGSVTSKASGSHTIIPLPTAGGTATATDTSICPNSTTTISLTGYTGTSINWQKSTNGTFWYTIVSTEGSGSTTTTYTTPALTTTTYYRAQVGYHPCYIPSSVASVTIIPGSLGGTATAIAPAVCLGSSTTITLTGHSGTIQWQESVDGVTGWVNVTGGSGATTASYNTPAITGTLYYRASVTNNSCVSYSTVASVFLNTATAITGQPSTTAQTYCQNGTPTDLSVTATGAGLSYQWYSNTTASTSGATLITGATTATYTPDTTTVAALYYYCVVTGTCGSVTSGFTGIITVNPLPVISGSTTVGVGDAVTLTATTTAASSNAWVSSNPTIASVSNSGVLNGLLTGTTTITYTNNNGCTDTEIISVTIGTTQPPILNLPATGTSGVSTLNINYTLPETPLAGSVRLTFTPSTGGNPIVWTMNDATSATFAYPVGSNPTLFSPVVSGSSLDFTTYNITLSYQDVYGNPAASVTNTSIQFLAPPANLSYNLPSTFTKDSVVNNIVPSITGTATSFSVSPALPTGLTLNTTTGVISGTPTVATTLTSYVVTATNSFGSTSYTLSFAVDKATPTITSMAAITKTFGDAAFILTAPTSNGTGAFTFASTDTAVATISGTTVTIVGVGTATITATQATDANYLAGLTSTTLTVGKATPVLSNFNVITTTIDSPSFTLTAPTSSGGIGAISYTSSNPAVATISGTTVTMVGVGTAIITATQASDVNYNSVSITALLTVGVGTTQPPILTSPATGTSGVSTLNIIYTLPETPLAGSVRLTFTPTAGGTPIVWTMTNATSTTFAYPVGSNPTLLSHVVSGSPLAFTTYNLTLSYQDVYGSPGASVTNTSIQFLAPPSITLANTSYSGLINTVFTTITVTSSGGAVSSFTISPNLPAGLTLNTTTGSISGTPTVDLTATNFTITATNLAGTASVQFTLLIDTVANNQIVDTDGDGVLDSIDTDDDGDGVSDVNDAFPINKNEWTDTDRDGIGNNADTDDDNDGILDGCDVDINGDGIPDNGTDLDADGINDGCDTDKDGDGVNNTSDNCPNSPNSNQADRDRDGQGDICDLIELNIAQAITPNGDGVNDTWVIYNIENHPGTIVRVFNKWGKEVFYSNDYKNDWDGHYRDNDKSLPSSGSYLYIIDLGGDGSVDSQGWLYITK